MIPPSELLVVMALPEEEQGLLAAEGAPLLFTGLGKINAALVLTRRLVELRLTGRLPRLVVNFGTVGSHKWPTGSVVASHRFVQRDMDVTPLGFAHGHTPFDEHGGELVFAPVFHHLPQVVCGSGDNFETAAAGQACDVVDMEAYAKAKACLHEGVAFASAKYVTDGADEGAAAEWTSNLPRAAAAFRDLYRELVRA